VAAFVVFHLLLVNNSTQTERDKLARSVEWKVDRLEYGAVSGLPCGSRHANSAGEEKLRTELTRMNNMKINNLVKRYQRFRGTC
jgi:hypothetical protein